MLHLFEKLDHIEIKQNKEMFEIITDWETANSYNLLDKDNNLIGHAAERSKGVLHKIIRNILRSHRSLIIDMWDENDKHIIKGERGFYFFFSDMKVVSPDESPIGEIKTRFGIIKRKYDLIDSMGRVFARIESPRWRLWTFKIFNRQNKEAGVITKRWGGIFNEGLTDSDQFMVDLSEHPWNEKQKAIILFAGLCIDLDFFEDNSSSVLDLVT